MKNTIILTSDEAKRCEVGKEFSFIRLLKEQPPDDIPHSEMLFKEKMAFSEEQEPYSAVFIPLQYPVGAKLGVRETWAWHYCKPFGVQRKTVIFKDQVKPLGINLIQNYKWQSPATMPAEAIRKHIIVESNAVKRVQELTLIGLKAHLPALDILHPEWRGIRKTYQHEQIRQEFINHWNPLYAKPRKCKDGYESFPWDMNWWQNYAEDSNNTDVTYSFNVPYCKGKPLTIHANAYIEFIKGTVL